MSSITDIDITPPSVFGRDGGTPEWLNCYYFDASLEKEAIDTAMETIPKCTYVWSHGENDFLLFRTRGYMDEAIQDGTEKIRPVLERFILPNIVEVLLIHRRELKSYDVTRTALGMLGIG